MPGTVVITRTSRHIGPHQNVDGNKAKEVILSLLCTSDSADGTIPDTDINGMGDYVLDELQPIPNATVITGSPSVILEDANGMEIYDSLIIAPTDNSVLAGLTGSPSSKSPRCDDDMSIQFVQPGSHTTSQDVGNSKIITFELRFLQK